MRLCAVRCVHRDKKRMCSGNPRWWAKAMDREHMKETWFIFCAFAVTYILQRRLYPFLIWKRNWRGSTSYVRKLLLISNINMRLHSFVDDTGGSVRNALIVQSKIKLNICQTRTLLCDTEQPTHTGRQKANAVDRQFTGIFVRAATLWHTNECEMVKLWNYVARMNGSTSEW